MENIVTKMGMHGYGALFLTSICVIDVIPASFIQYKSTEYADR